MVDLKNLYGIPIRGSFVVGLDQVGVSVAQCLCSVYDACTTPPFNTQDRFKGQTILQKFTNNVALIAFFASVLNKEFS